MRIDKDKTIALIIDVQEKLFPHICGGDSILERMKILLQGLKLLEIPMILNEQYKKGLGETVAPIKDLIADVKSYEKVTFSCCQNTPTLTHILESGRKIALVMGAETHVCIMQTCLDLIASGISPVLVVDCVGSRNLTDHDIAIKRMSQAGVVLATVESILFELCKSSKNPVFKDISQLVK
ncbi:MAG: isochorismatase family protein [Campylobacteraceae bacterium]|nr:isochorismatase family protein [Campylobacteraceae bacterium]